MKVKTMENVEDGLMPKKNSKLREIAGIVFPSGLPGIMTCGIFLYAMTVVSGTQMSDEGKALAVLFCGGMAIVGLLFFGTDTDNKVIRMRLDELKRQE